MSGHRFDELNDAERPLIADAEADLERLLAVQPSPEFAARVRARIGAERHTGPRWIPGWRFALAAASLAIAGIVVSLAIRKDTPDVPQPAPVVATRPAVLAPSVAPPVNDEQRSAKHEQRPVSREPLATNREPRVASREPEVLVPAERRIALQRALSLSPSGALDQRMFPAQPLPTVISDDVPPVPPIVVEQVVVPLIDVTGATEKGPGRN